MADHLQRRLAPALVAGFGTAVAMWTAWYILHIPGIRVPIQVATPILGVVLVLGCLVGVASAGRIPKPWLTGMLAGLVTGALDLLLLGSKVVTQPATTGDLAGRNNELRPDAPIIVLGFLAACAVAGAVAGLLASRLARPRAAQPVWLGRFAAVLAFAIAPLIVAGGLVTSTESGMAVPDSVTTYGSISFLFPLSLMAEPRVFFEHTHRLFGTLVGITAIVLALWAVASARAWAVGAIGLAVVAALAGTLAAELAGAMPTSAAIGIIIAISAVALVLTARAILAARIPAAGMGMLVLVVGQGLLGALRVSEISTPLALVHGVFAQLVLASAAAMAASIYRASHTLEPMTEQVARAYAQGNRLAKLALASLVVQLILGAGYRHTASHAFLGGHVLFAIAVATLAILAGMALGQAPRDTPAGRWAKRRGKGLIHLVITQVALGIVAVILVTTRDANRPIPLPDELAAAHPVPTVEAAFTTAHQATGAALLALMAASFVRTRKPDEPAIDAT